MGMLEDEWYREWFNSPYYHVLYAHRDLKESNRFLDALLEVLDLSPGARVLDLACGKGRHSRYLADKGFYTTGLDLSAESIEYARQFENDHLSFFQHDMRQPFRYNYYDCIFNFFTSFGYFNTRQEHIQTLQNVRKGMVDDGLFVIDFLNVVKALKDIPRRETIQRKEGQFDVQVIYDQNKIIKRIRLHTSTGVDLRFEERVWAFKLDDFEKMFKEAGLKINRTFGDYDMGTFDKDGSNRLIIEAKQYE